MSAGGAAPPRSAREMAVAEANALALGVGVDALMENAGRAVAEEAVRHLPTAPARVAIVAGPGNNGGDATCAAHYLAQWGHAPELWLVRPANDIRSAAARRCYDRVATRLPVHSGSPKAGELQGFALVLDGLLGTGAIGPLRGVYAEAVGAIREGGVPVLSIDLPTGLGSPDALRPDWTVTFTRPKEGLDQAHGGEITLREIGIPEAALTETGPGEFHLYPSYGPGGRNVRVLVLGGGPFAGAPAFAALAALRAGAERVTVLCPRSIAAAVQTMSPDLVVLPVGEREFEPEDLPAVSELLSHLPYSALIVGMGAGRAEGTLRFFHELLAKLPANLPVVVDADALEGGLDLPAGDGGSRPMILTPNAGELARLTHIAAGATAEERTAAAEQLAREHRLYVLAKGDPDLVVGGAEVFVNRHHHPAGAVAGVGDLLSGVVGSLLGQGVGPVAAARLGAYWVGDAGLRRFEHEGFGMIASDVLAEIPRALVDGLRRVRV